MLLSSWQGTVHGVIIIPVEPNLTTAPELKNILIELSRLEPIFHWPPRDMTRDQLLKMTIEDFWETGASGRRYSREFVMEELERRASKTQPDVWKTSDFYCRCLAKDVFLLTYTLLQDNSRLTRRATIWQRTKEGWKIVYHQGTVVQEA